MKAELNQKIADPRCSDKGKEHPCKNKCNGPSAENGYPQQKLINALVADGGSIVPAGGIGPHTAQAIVVKYGDRAAFKAEYHAKERLVDLLASLIDIYAQEIACNQRTIRSLCKLISKDLSDRIETNPLGNNKEQQTTFHEYLKHANLLVTGQQGRIKKTTYLIDSLAILLYEKVIFNSVLEKADAKRIDTARELLLRKLFECTNDDNHNYLQFLNDHATGYLAPIIKSFYIRVESELLRNGLVFIDLPGVGIDGDIHQKVTQGRFENADIIVLVVSTRGIGVAEHNLMKKADIYGRLFSAHTCKKKHQIRLLIVVTHVDDIAYSRFMHDRKRKKWQHLADVCEETENDVRRQLECLLNKECTALGKTNDRLGVVEQIIRSTEIVPVAAEEFRKFSVNEPDDRPFIIDTIQSNIPRLRRLLSEL